MTSHPIAFETRCFLWNHTTRLFPAYDGCVGGDPYEMLSAAECVVDSMWRGESGRAIAMAHECFERGTDLDDESQLVLTHAFEARVLLPDVVRLLSDRGLDVSGLQSRITAADEAHAEHRGAVFMVSDERYETIVFREKVGAGLPLDEGAWWCERARVDRLVPPCAVTVALHSIANEEDQEVLP